MIETAQTFGKRWAQEAGDLLDHSIRGNECIVFAGQFLDQLLVPIELFQVIRRHGIDTMMLGAIDIMLIAEDATDYRYISQLVEFLMLDFPAR